MFITELEIQSYVPVKTTCKEDSFAVEVDDILNIIKIPTQIEIYSLIQWNFFFHSRSWFALLSYYFRRVYFFISLLTCGKSKFQECFHCTFCVCGLVLEHTGICAQAALGEKISSPRNERLRGNKRSPYFWNNRRTKTCYWSWLLYRNRRI